LAELERFYRAYKALPIRALPITEALPIKALPVDTDTNEPATNTNEPAILLETNEPVDTNNPLETNELAIPSANATEPLISTLETYEPVDTNNPLETDEPAIPFANTIEPLVEDALTLNTLTLPPLPLCSIPATGFG
jgi:hypothetical protein